VGSVWQRARTFLVCSVLTTAKRRCGGWQSRGEVGAVVQWPSTAGVTARCKIASRKQGLGPHHEQRRAWPTGIRELDVWSERWATPSGKLLQENKVLQRQTRGRDCSRCLDDHSTLLRREIHQCRPPGSLRPPFPPNPRSPPASHFTRVAQAVGGRHGPRRTMLARFDRYLLRPAVLVSAHSCILLRCHKKLKRTPVEPQGNRMFAASNPIHSRHWHRAPLF
jgi:hypothetical protein